MAHQVELLKKNGTYVDKNGEEKHYTNFYLRCGDTLIPIQLCYFEGEDGKDYQYQARKAVLSAFAETLPEKPAEKKTSATKDKKSATKTADEDLPY